MWPVVIVLLFHVSSQIDALAMKGIDDASLEHYIPVYGDRIATRRYCMDKQRQKEDSTKTSLLEKLRQRMRTTATHYDEASEPGPAPV